MVNIVSNRIVLNRIESNRIVGPVSKIISNRDIGVLLQPYLAYMVTYCPVTSAF